MTLKRKANAIVAASVFLSGVYSLPCWPADQASDLVVDAERAIQTGNRRNVKLLLAQITILPDAAKLQLLEFARKSLHSAQWQEQAAAATVIGALGPMAAPSVPELVAACDARMENVAWAVAAAIAKIGKPAVPALAKALDEAPKDIHHGWHLMAIVQALGPQAVALAPNAVPFLFNGGNTGAVRAFKAMGPGSVPALCKALESDDRGIVTAYVSETLSAFPNEAAPILSKMVTSKNALASKNAAYVLAHLPQVSGSAAPGLAQGLADERTARDAQTALIKAGSAAVPDVLEMLGSANDKTTLRAIEVLRSIGANAKAALPKLQSMLALKDTGMRAEVAACMLCIDANNKTAVNILSGLLSAPEPDVRLHTAVAVAHARDGGAPLVRQLITLLHDPQSPVRVAAANALGEIGRSAAPALAALLEATHSEHPAVVNQFEGLGMTSAVQGAALTAIAKIGDTSPASIAALAEAVSGNSYQSAQALNSLEKMGARAAPAVPTLISALATKSGDSRQILRTLKAIGPAASAALPQLRGMLDARTGLKAEVLEAIDGIETDVSAKRADALKAMNDRQTREVAIQMLAKYPSKDGNTLNLLLAGLADSSLKIRWSSIEALGSMGSAAALALPLLIKENIRSSYMRDQRSRAFKAIKQIDPTGEQTIALLSKPLEDSFQVRGAVELLEYIDSPATAKLAQETRTRWKLR